MPQISKSVNQREYPIHFVNNEAEIVALFPLLQEVCPDIKSKAQLLNIAREMISKENCHFVYIRDKLEECEEKEYPVSFAGYRILSSLSRGRFMHVHYMGTLPSAKRRGYAGALIDWMILKGKEEGVTMIRLNSGHQRIAAHKLYMNKGFGLRCHHFCLELKPLRDELVDLE